MKNIFLFVQLFAVILFINCSDPSEQAEDPAAPPDPPDSEKFILSLTVLPEGSGTISCVPDSAEYEEGALVVLTANPNDGYEFSEWGLGMDSENENVATVKMDSDKTVTAVFADESYVLTADQYEEDDDFAAAKPIILDAEAQYHTIHDPEDVDYMSVYLTAGVYYDIQTYYADDEFVDTTLILFDSSETLVTGNRNSGGTYCAKIIYQCMESGTYYIYVEGDDYIFGEYGATGPYLVDIKINNDPPSGDVYEHDNSFAEAKPIVIDAAVQVHTFHINGDTDYMSVELTDGETYTIETDSVTMTTTDTILTLYDSSENIVAENDDISSNWRYSRITYECTSSGTYYIKAEQYYFGNFGYDYSIGVYLEDIPDLPPEDIYEPDNIIAEANPIVIDAAAQEHTFHIDGDIDYMSVELTNGETYIIETHYLTESTDTMLTLYDSSGIVASDDDGGTGYYSQITYSCNSTETYFIEVKGFSGNTGDYSVDVILGVTPDGDNYEPDNIIAEANEITINAAAQEHTLHIDGDTDYMSVELTNGETYIIETHYLTESTDTMLTLYDSSGIVASDDDGGTGYYSQITYSCTSTETYFIEVKGFSGNTGDYTIDINTITLLLEYSRDSSTRKMKKE